MRHHEETLSTVEPIYVNPNGGLASPLKEKQMMFSLFYFSTVDELLDANKYRLYLVSYWRQQLLHGFNDIAAQTLPQDLCAHQLFEEQGARTPEAVALVHEGEQLVMPN